MNMKRWTWVKHSNTFCYYIIIYMRPANGVLVGSFTTGGSFAVVLMRFFFFFVSFTRRVVFFEFFVSF